MLRNESAVALDVFEGFRRMLLMMRMMRMMLVVLLVMLLVVMRMLDAVRNSPVLEGQVAQDIRFLFVTRRLPPVDSRVRHRCKHLSSHIESFIRALINGQSIISNHFKSFQIISNHF